ncbi:LysR family transcriptional regulator [Denitratisoma oestradiolicum]|uniref:LysR family transcriptional regulator n=1 Tax=Denitratisoma oestradiolicum TaxID=311182 RepID=A0A6S6Y369_9PROT|nr:LysR family transcriptional regulator [Denitratisoma oestradiolicum]TWO79911.1 LysR family transcriptional regulator [Denitratisoma oestradiolicum]CAB1369666.1 LysR family transcriptional regulator [Denitratisoma oestradiolicum]
MDRLTQIEAFVTTAIQGSLSAAARQEGVTPAIMGRRINALEARLGVKLLLRTTRRLSLTQEGAAFLEDCQRLLGDLGNAEASVSLGAVRASGHLCISAPAGFGRRHVAPRVAAFLDVHPEVTAALDLSDRVVDIVNEGIDCAVRIGGMTDSNLISVRLGEVRRALVGSPDYLARRGIPAMPDDLANHECLPLVQQAGWLFRDAAKRGETQLVKIKGRLQCNDGSALREWALQGRGLAWRSRWEVGEDLRAGRLVAVLEDYAAPPLAISAVFPQRQIPLRLRLFIEHLKAAFAGQDY